MYHVLVCAVAQERSRVQLASSVGCRSHEDSRFDQWLLYCAAEHNMITPSPQQEDGEPLCLTDWRVYDFKLVCTDETLSV